MALHFNRLIFIGQPNPFYQLSTIHLHTRVTQATHYYYPLIIGATNSVNMLLPWSFLNSGGARRNEKTSYENICDHSR
jgi:hypothetical protein